MTFEKVFRNLVCLCLFSLIVLTSCSDGDEIPNPPEEENPTGKLVINITDSPIDDPEVKAVFVTVQGIEMDGEEFTLDVKKTIEISKLTHGMTEVMINADVPAKNYGELTLVLDYDQDASGNVPGCFVLTEDDVKHNLDGGLNNKIQITNLNIEVQESSTIESTIDFDLRKSIEYQEDSVDRYNFSSSLAQSLRYIEGTSHNITGTVSDDLSISGDKVVVYIYPRGEFKKDTETKGNVPFKNAITSSAVDADGHFSLHFIPPGEYELQLANYKMNEENNRLTLQSMLNVNVLGGLDLSLINLNKDIDTELIVLTEIEI